MDILFSPHLFDNLNTKAINYCGTVRPNRKGMPSDFGRKLRLKQADTKTRVKDDLTAIVWKEIKCKRVDKYASSSSRR
jgi:hypothetical protein